MQWGYLACCFSVEYKTFSEKFPIFFSLSQIFRDKRDWFEVMSLEEWMRMDVGQSLTTFLMNGSTQDPSMSRCSEDNNGEIIWLIISFDLIKKHTITQKCDSNYDLISLP